MSKKSKTAGLEQFKMEAAREVGVTLGQGYNGELTAKQAGRVDLSVKSGESHVSP